MEAHVKHLDEALRTAESKAIGKALKASQHAETEVIEFLKLEVKHQERVDKALAAMTKVDGPADPPLTEKDPVKRADERKRERAKACQGNEDTRSCITWLKLEPVDLEIKALDVDISKARRFVVDAEIRSQKAEQKARPKFDPGDLIHSLVGPFQIQQVVLNWMDADRDVDREQVDRCQTCHMGAVSGGYTDASLPRQFRSHPWRSTLMNTHPVETFGCTSCHQGQGRATDKLPTPAGTSRRRTATSAGTSPATTTGRIPSCPWAASTRSSLTARTTSSPSRSTRGAGPRSRSSSGAPRSTTRPRRPRTSSPTDYRVEEKGHHAGEGAKLTDETLFLGAIQKQVQAVVETDDTVKAKWHAVVRKLDNRVQLGLEQNDPAEVLSAKETPVFNVKFTKPELAETLGFGGVVETTGRQPLLTASASPSVPVRGEGMPHFDKGGRYVPPHGSEGLQVPDEMRNRFIESLPEMESSCLRCHTGDVDLKPRMSKAKFVTAKLEREKAEAWIAKDRDGYKKAHDGSEELPVAVADPADAVDPVPTFTEGRHLFRKLNCTGCHILDGYPWDRNSGPGLDNVTAKVTPEWILGWIRNPRGWRAKTRMPNLWPKPLDPASKRPIPPSSPEYDKWKATMRDETVAIASFLVERSENPSTRPGAPKDAQAVKTKVAGYADVPGASADKGKVIFESYGCQGCHATSDADVPEPWKSRERDVAPTLANMGGKSSADWGRLLGREPEPLLARDQDAEPEAQPRRGGERGQVRRLAHQQAARAGRGREGRRRPGLRQGQAQRARALRQRRRAAHDPRRVRREAHRLLRLLRLPLHHRLREVVAHRPRAGQLRQEGHQHPRLRLRHPGPPPPDDGDLRHPQARLPAHLPARSHRAQDGRLRPLPAGDPGPRDLPQGAHQRQAAQRLRAQPAPRVLRRPRRPADRRRLQLPRLPRHRVPRRRHRRPPRRAARRRRAEPRALPRRRGHARAAGVALLLPPRPGQERDPPLAPPRVGLRRRGAGRQAAAAHAPRSTSARSRSPPSSATSPPGTGRSTRTRPPAPTSSPTRRRPTRSPT